jgi:hypothetical protein
MCTLKSNIMEIGYRSPITKENQVSKVRRPSNVSFINDWARGHYVHSQGVDKDFVMVMCEALFGDATTFMTQEAYALLVESNVLKENVVTATYISAPTASYMTDNILVAEELEALLKAYRT